MFIGRELEPSARHYIASLHGGTQIDGLELYRNGGVEAVKETARGVFNITIHKQNGSLCGVTLMRDKDGWLGDCACEAGEDCEHCCAAMYALLLSDEKQFKKARTAVPLKPDTFHAKAIAFANRPLTKIETDAAKAVDTLFQEHGTAYGVLQTLVDQVAGIASRGWRYQTIKVWPDMHPTTVDEAWML